MQPLTICPAAALQVETYFISQGLLLPGSSQGYWLGLKATPDSWPRFSWLSRSIPDPSNATYSNWATGPPSQPNNASELCGAANSSFVSSSGVWSWSDADCSMALASICRRDVAFTYSYTSAKSNSTYYLGTGELNALAAELACNALGGHLVSYGSAAEQREVEAAFVAQGGIIPGYHQLYWLGLQASPYPQFTWLDK